MILLAVAAHTVIPRAVDASRTRAGDSELIEPAAVASAVDPLGANAPLPETEARKAVNPQIATE